MIIKDVQTIPTDELRAFEKMLNDKAIAARELYNKLLEERDDMMEERAMCEMVIDAFKKRKGYKFGNPLSEYIWLDIHSKDEDTTDEEYHAIIRVRQLREELADNRIAYIKALTEANTYRDVCDRFSYFTQYDINSKVW